MGILNSTNFYIGGKQMNIFIGYAHTLEGLGTGAVGYINESKESRILSDMVAKILREMGYNVDVTGIRKSSNYLAELCKLANKKRYDLCLQIHFNAYKNTNSEMGTETLYQPKGSGKTYAIRVNDKLNKIYKNRGAKPHEKLYWLNNTKYPSILIETCFVDSKGDTDKYKIDKEKTAIAIAEGITNQTYKKPSNNNTTNSDKIYRVIVGSYSYNNAKTKQQELVQKGYKDTFLLPID